MKPRQEKQRFWSVNICRNAPYKLTRMLYEQQPKNFSTVHPHAHPHLGLNLRSRARAAAEEYNKRSYSSALVPDTPSSEPRRGEPRLLSWARASIVV